MSRNTVGDAIHRAAGMLDAASHLDLRADEFRHDALTMKRQRLAIAAVLSSEADKLRDMAVKTRANAERVALTNAARSAVDGEELREILATICEKNSWLKNRSVAARHIRNGNDACEVSIGSAIEAMLVVQERVREQSK